MDEFKFGFRLAKIKTEQFAFFEENYNAESDINLNTNLSFGPTEEKGFVVLSMKFTFEIKQEIFLIIQVSCIFEIEPSFWSDNTKDNSITFPKKFVAHLAMITVGTTRGILHSKTERTQFNEIIIPTTDVESLIEKDLVFNI